VALTTIWDHEGSQIEFHQERTSSQYEIFTLKFCKYEVLTKKIQSICHKQKLFHSVTENQTHNLCVGGQLEVPLWYQCVVLLDLQIEFSLFIERTDYRSNLAKTILFENCSCFSKIPFSISVESPRIFQCLISIPASH